MILENQFVLDVPIGDAWAALNDPERVAPCFPGATLTDYTGDSFTGTVKVKLGPISLTYRGTGTYVSRDASTHTVVIAASGRDARGNGTAEATVTGRLAALGPGETQVTMSTDMAVTGRPAQFGRGVMTDVSDGIIQRFADRLATVLAPEGEVLHTETEPTVTGVAATGTPRPSVARIHRPAVSPPGAETGSIDLLDAVGGPVLRRMAPIALGVALLVLLARLLRR